MIEQSSIYVCVNILIILIRVGHHLSLINKYREKFLVVSSADDVWFIPRHHMIESIPRSPSCHIFRWRGLIVNSVYKRKIIPHPSKRKKMKRSHKSTVVGVVVLVDIIIGQSTHVRRPFYNNLLTMTYIEYRNTSIYRMYYYVVAILYSRYFIFRKLGANRIVCCVKLWFSLCHSLKTRQSFTWF